MAGKPKRTSEIREWVQALFIVIGIGVGVWQFQVKGNMESGKRPDQYYDRGEPEGSWFQRYEH